MLFLNENFSVINSFGNFCSAGIEEKLPEQIILDNYTYTILIYYCEKVNINITAVRVNNFREKSSAGIDGLKLGAGFEQDC